jgi:class 3 adenylate cyclase
MSEAVLDYQKGDLQEIRSIPSRNHTRVQSLSLTVGIIGAVLLATDIMFRALDNLGNLLLLISHSFLVFYMLVGFIYSKVKKVKQIPRLFTFVYGLCTFIMLWVGGAGDQILTGSIAVYLYGVLALYLILIYNRMDAIILGVLGVGGFAVYILLTQPSQELIVSHLINGTIVTIVAVAFSIVNYKFVSEDITNKKLINEKHLKNKELLENILPLPIIQEIEENGASRPKLNSNVSVVFIDFVGFSRITKQLQPIALVSKLNKYFTKFDGIIDYYKLEKVKTIGDGYMFAGGLFSPGDQLERVLKASKDILAYVDYESQNSAEGVMEWRIRLGVHVGKTITGIIGKRKFVYDLWGDTVNIASRIEAVGIEGKINVSEEVARRMKDKFNFTQRGTFALKNVGHVRLYVLEE